MIRSLALAAAVAALTTMSVVAQDTRSFSHDSGTSEIPAQPRRIITLHDVGLTIPLIELGIMPVASGGRLRADGSVYLRSGMSLLGVDFDNSPIGFVDKNDMEAISAQSPDLIITDETDAALLRQYNLIAPAISLDRYNRSGTEHFRVLADAVDATDAFETLQARLEWQVEGLRQAIPAASEISVSILHAGETGSIAAGYVPTYGSLGHVLTEVGFAMVPLMAELGDSASVSAERITELDADFIIVTYRNDQGETPATARADLEAALPGWCDFLHACRNDQVLFLPRDEAFTVSYNAMDLAIATLHAGIAGRNFAPIGKN